MKSPELHINTWEGWLAFVIGLAIGSGIMDLIQYLIN